MKIDDDNILDPELATMSADQIVMKARLIENETAFLKNQFARLNEERKQHMLKLEENKKKIKQNKQLPYLVGHVVEILEVDEETDDNNPNVHKDAKKKTVKCAVIKTTSRQV
jgi:26S proteasome regulatory subunit T5